MAYHELTRRYIMYKLEPYSHQSNLDLHITFKACGYECCIPGHTVGPNIPDYYTFHFVTEGCGVLRTRNHTYSIQAGEGFLLYPHELCYYTPDLMTPWTYYWVGFHSDKAHLLDGISTRKHPTFTHNEVSLNIAKQIHQLTKSSLPISLKDYQFLGYLYSLFYQLKLINHPTIHLEGHGQRYLDYAISYISQYYHRSLTINEIAAYVHIDRTYLFKLFKDAYGLSPKAYLIAYRMNKATDLLSHEELTIKEVAKAVGYEDYSLFSRIFKKNKGISPRAYRRLNLEGTHN